MKIDIGTKYMSFAGYTGQLDSDDKTQIVLNNINPNEFGEMIPLRFCNEVLKELECS